MFNARWGRRAPPTCNKIECTIRLYVIRQSRPHPSMTSKTTQTQTTPAGPANWIYAKVKYTGSNGKAVYRGGLDRFGRRTGHGVFRYPTLIYGLGERNHPTIISWFEYCGEWRDDLPNGYGYATRFSCDGYSIASVERGIWVGGRMSP